ncbi:hypothetical protein PR002_g32684 [Phytophthora rubi]|uniref:Uncharacterized protein n=1 Tax=Phytophthora rubi TaxID=129364 RepID=A0A6A3G636_9STRA|nr:hypothetical protein PR002_g32684 [Phytophthora rubi]
MAGNRSRSKSIINMDALVANVASCNSISSSMEVLVARLDQRGKRRRQTKLVVQQHGRPRYRARPTSRAATWRAAPQAATQSAAAWKSSSHGSANVASGDASSNSMSSSMDAPLQGTANVASSNVASRTTSCNAISSSMEVLVARLGQRGKRRCQQQLDQQQ